MPGDPAFDWPRLMWLGLRGLGLPPDVFWAMTPAELQILLGPDRAAKPLGQGRLRELMKAYPDGVADRAASGDEAGTRFEKGETT